MLSITAPSLLAPAGHARWPCGVGSRLKPAFCPAAWTKKLQVTAAAAALSAAPASDSSSSSGSGSGGGSGSGSAAPNLGTQQQQQDSRSLRRDNLEPERLKQLQAAGLAVKDRIKIGRRGVAEGLVEQVQRRWRTAEVARLYCHGKTAANMRLVCEQLEYRTGGIVVQCSGGSIWLYRGDGWQPPADKEPSAREAEAEAAGTAPTLQQQEGQQQQQQQQQCSS